MLPSLHSLNNNTTPAVFLQKIRKRYYDSTWQQKSGDTRRVPEGNLSNSDGKFQCVTNNIVIKLHGPPMT